LLINFRTKEKKPFLCCIVDEASQTTEPETLLPIVLDFDKLILVGDPKQLGATVLSAVCFLRILNISIWALSSITKVPIDYFGYTLFRKRKRKIMPSHCSHDITTFINEKSMGSPIL